MRTVVLLGQMLGEGLHHHNAIVVILPDLKMNSMILRNGLIQTQH